ALALGACGGGGDGDAAAYCTGGGGGWSEDLTTIGLVALRPAAAARETNEQNVPDTFTEEEGDDRKLAPAANLDPLTHIATATSVAEWALSEFPDGARYLVLEGPAGVSVVNERNEGWDAVMDSHPEFEKVGAQTANWSTEEARSVFETVLQSENNDIDLVFAQ